jgi:hypothetical protein
MYYSDHATYILHVVGSCSHFSLILPHMRITRIAVTSVRAHTIHNTSRVLGIRALQVRQHVLPRNYREDEEMMRTCIELMQPFSTNRRNATDTLYDGEFRGEVVPAADAGVAATAQLTVASADVAASTLPTVNEIASAVVSAVMERMTPGGVPAAVEAAAAAAVPMAVETRAAESMAPVVPPSSGTCQKRKRECDKSEYRPCCKRYREGHGAMKVERIAADPVLAQLVRETASAKPAVCQKRLCEAGYCATRKEIMNYRNSRREVTRCRPG